MEINELIQKSFANAQAHGFWKDYEFVIDGESVAKEINEIEATQSVKSMKNNAISTRLMLIVGEVSEAQEGLRHNDIDNFKEELADVAIRLADLCGGLEIDLEAEIEKKMEKNKNRPYKHGKSF